MHRFMDGEDLAEIPEGANRVTEQRTKRAEQLESAGIDAAWALHFIDQPNIEEQDLRNQLERWRAAVEECQRRERAATEEKPIGFAPPSATGALDRSRIANPGQLSTAEATALRGDLKKLGYALGAKGSSGAWDADAFEGYKDFVENAVRAGRLTNEQATSTRPADRTVVRTLLRSAARTPDVDPALRATPAQHTMSTTVGPEFTTVTVRRRSVRRSTGHSNKPEDVELVQRALMTRGFYIDPAKMRSYDTSTQQAIQLYNASYRGLHERAGGSSTLVPGATMTRSIFGNAQETPHLTDGPRWGELQDDPSIGLVMYHTPGSYVTSWGTQRARDFMGEFARAVRAANPTSEVRANDISKKEGGPHPFHSGHQVGMEADITHWDQPDDMSRATWLEGPKAELRAMAAFSPRIAFIYNSNSELIAYGRSLGLNMIQIGGHAGHFHVGIKAWTGELDRS
jgi:hypothetical protein